MWRKSRPSPGESPQLNKTSIILKVAGTLKSNVPLGLFQHFQDKTLYFWKHDNNSTFNSFPGRCNTLSFFYLKCQFRYHFCDSLTRNRKNGTAGTDTEHPGGGGEDCVTCVAPHLLVKTLLASHKHRTLLSGCEARAGTISLSSCRTGSIRHISSLTRQLGGAVSMTGCYFPCFKRNES